MPSTNALIKTVSDDSRLITYRPRLNAKTGSVTATILFQQVLWRWDKNHAKPFYKYTEPPKVKTFYTPGDSWTEELGFTRYEFNGARKKIAASIAYGDPYPPNKPIVYWRDGNNLTWYDVNEPVAAAWLEEVYGAKQEKPISPPPTLKKPVSRNGKSRYPGKSEKAISGEIGKTAPPISENQKKKNVAESFDPNVLQIWQTTQDELQLQLPRETFDTWLRNARLLNFDDASATFTVGVHNVHAREWLEHRLKKVVLRTLRRVADNEDSQVSFEVIT